MDPEPMRREENYCLDVAGYLIVRNALTENEVQACNQALGQGGQSEGMLEWPVPLCDPFVQLRDHPVLAHYLEQICFGETRLAQTPRLIGDAAGASPEPLTGGKEPRDWSRSYYHQGQTRFCNGVLALWALADVNEGDGGFTLIPGSHKSGVEIPDEVLNGTDDMGLRVQPVLQAGDLLLCAETVLHGVQPWKGKGPQRLLTFGYIGGLVRQSNGLPPRKVRETPDWADEMTPVERVVMAVDRTHPSPVVQSDGQTCWVEEKPGVFHPSIHIRDSESDIDEKEFYFWDLCGYLILRGVMDDAWLAAANETLDRFADRIEPGNDGAQGSRRLAGTALTDLHGLFELPHPHCEPFRKMIAHPPVVQRMNWMTGSGFVLKSARAIVHKKGTSGLYLHSKSEPATPRNTYFLHNGRAFSEQINVAWQLRDVSAGDGGFVCVPGSHKARYSLPERLISCEEEMGLVKHVETKAGDAVLFMGASQTHGAYPWTNEIDRRAVIVTYVSRHLD